MTRALSCMLAGWLGVIAGLCHAEVPRFAPQMQRYSRVDGLPSDKVLSLALDPQGFIWIGTERGLVRFNGREFESPRIVSKLPSASIESLWVDSRNRIWASLGNHGICAFNSNYFADPDQAPRCFSTQANAAKRISANDVFAAFELKDRIFFVVFDQALVELDRETLTIRGTHQLPHLDIISATQLGGKAYLASYGGNVLELSLASGALQIRLVEPSQAAQSAVDKSQSHAAQSAIDKPQSQVAQSAIDKPQSQVAQSAIDKSQSQSQVAASKTAPLYVIESVFDAVWFPHRDGRLASLAKDPTAATASQISLKTYPLEGIDVPYAIASRGDALVLGHAKGLSVFEGDQRLDLSAVNGDAWSVPEGQITALQTDQQGGLWIAAARGLAYWPKARNELRWLSNAEQQAQPAIESSWLDGEQIWLAGHSGVQAFTWQNQTIGERLEVAGTDGIARPRVIRGDAESIWVGHQLGISRLDRKRKVWRHASDNGVRRAVDVLELDSFGVWANTSRKLLRRYDAALNVVQEIDEKQVGGEIEQMTRIADRLWIAGGFGLKYLQPDSTKLVSVRDQTVHAFCWQAELQRFVLVGKSHVELMNAAFLRTHLVPRPTQFDSDIGEVHCGSTSVLFSGVGGLWFLNQKLQLQRVADRGAQAEFVDRPTAGRLGSAVFIGAQQGLLRVDLAEDFNPVTLAAKTTAFPLWLTPNRNNLTISWNDPDPLRKISAVALNYHQPQATQFAFSFDSYETNFSDDPNFELQGLGFGSHQLIVSARDFQGRVVQSAPILISVQAPLWRRPAWIALSVASLSALLATWVLSWQRARQRRRHKTQESKHLHQIALARTESLGYISHEMRNLLNGVTANAELLRSATDAAQQRKLSGRIVEAGESLASLLDQALDHAKLVGNRLQLHAKPVDLAELLSDIEHSYTVSFRTSSLQLIVEFSDIDFWVLTDELRLRQIIVNLLSNAAKFGARGRILLRAETTPLDAHLDAQVDAQVDPLAQRLLCVSIADEGPGISIEDRERIFKPYVRLQSQQRGTGLGLSVSAELCRAMRGELMVIDSVPGFSGCAMQLKLPLLLSEPPEQTLTRHFDRKLTILVVEDQLSNQELIQALLEKRGHTVQLASNAFSAIAQFLPAPDLVLMDLDLSGESGIEVLALMRASGLSAEVPVLALTGRADLQTEQQCLAAGMKGLIAKPYRLKMIESRLLEIFG